MAFFSGLALTERNKAKALYRAEKHLTKHVLKSAPLTAVTGTGKKPEIQKGEYDGRYAGEYQSVMSPARSVPREDLSAYSVPSSQTSSAL